MMVRLTLILITIITSAKDGKTVTLLTHDVA